MHLSLVIYLRQDSAISPTGSVSSQEEISISIFVVSSAFSALLHSLNIVGGPKCVSQLMHEGVATSETKELQASSLISDLFGYVQGITEETFSDCMSLLIFCAHPFNLRQSGKHSHQMFTKPVKVSLK